MAGAISTFSPIINTTTADSLEDGQSSSVIITDIIQFIVVVVGIIGNICLFILMQNKHIKKESYSVYLAFAAVIDSMSLFIDGLTDIYRASGHGRPDDVWTKTAFTCGLWNWFTTWPSFLSVWLMIAFCSDRFLYICFPLAAEKLCRRGVALGACSLSLIITGLVVLPWALAQPNRTDDERFICGVSENGALIGAFLSAVVVILLPLVIMSVLNICILVKLRQMNAFAGEETVTLVGKNDIEQERPSDSTVERNERVLVRLKLVMFYFLVMKIISWIPIAVIQLIEIAYYIDEDLPENKAAKKIAWHVCLLIWLVTFGQNFYVLMLLSPYYRYRMKTTCMCHSRFRGNNNETLQAQDTLSPQVLRQLAGHYVSV